MKTLRDALRSEELTLTAELSLTPRDDAPQIVDQARALANAVDAVQIPDHRHLRPHASNIAVAALLLENGIDPVVQMNCRDRNRIALQSDILGARALGANNLLVLRGSDFPDNHRPRASGVFDLGAIDLIATAAAIRDGAVFAESEIDAATELYIGTVATAFEPGDDWQPDRLTSKADAGAQFIQLQICHDLDVLRAYVNRIVEAKLTWRFQLLAALSVFPSAAAARQTRNERPDSIIPSTLVRRLEQSDDESAEGVAIAAEQLREIAAIPGLAGVTLSSPENPASIPAAIAASGLRS